MKSLKTLFCVALLLCCGFLFTACGGKEPTIPAKTGFDITDVSGQTKHVSTWQQATSNLTGGETITLFEDVVVNSSFKISVGLTINGNNHTIKAKEGFDLNLDKPIKEKTRNVISVEGNEIVVKLKNLTVDANQQCRGISLSNKGDLTLDNVTVKNGYISNANADGDNFYTAGLAAANFTNLKIIKANFVNNRLAEDLTTKDVYYVKNSVDLFIGAKAECAINSIKADSVFVNASNGNAGVISLNTGKITNMYLEYDNDGAVLNNVDGEVINLLISTTTAGETFNALTAKKGKTYTAGSIEAVNL